MTKRKTRRLLRFPLTRRAGCRFILLMVVAVVGMTGIMVYGFTNLLNPVGDTANQFFTALKAGDTAAAYRLMSNAYEAEYDEGVFESAILEYTKPPTDWQFMTFSVSGIYGRVRGSVTIEGQRYNSLITLVYEDGGWAVTGFDLGTNPIPGLMPLATPTPAT